MTRHLAGRRRLRAATCAAAAAVILLILLASCGSFSDRNDIAADGELASPRAEGSGSGTGLTRWAPSERPRIPNLSGRTLDGQRLDVADWRGRVIVLNTWGSWCAPCRKEAFALQRVWKETEPQGVQFLGIDTRDNDAAARAFVREFGISYPSLVDDDGRLLLALGSTIPVAAVPSTLIVDQRGRAAARVIGGVTYQTLIGLISDTLAEVPVKQAP